MSGKRKRYEEYSDEEDEEDRINPEEDRINPEDLQYIDSKNFFCLDSKGNKYNDSELIYKSIYLYKDLKYKDTYHCLTRGDIIDLNNKKELRKYKSGNKVEYVGLFGSGNNDDSELHLGLFKDCNSVINDYKLNCNKYHYHDLEVQKKTIPYKFDEDDLLDLIHISNNTNWDDLTRCIKGREIYKNVCLYKKGGIPDKGHQTPINLIRWILRNLLEYPRDIEKILENFRDNYKLNLDDLNKIKKFIKGFEVDIKNEFIQKLNKELKEEKKK